MFKKLLNYIGEIQISYIFMGFAFVVWAQLIYGMIASNNAKAEQTQLNTTTKLLKERLANPDYLYVVSDPNTINNLQQKIKIHPSRQICRHPQP